MVTKCAYSFICMATLADEKTLKKRLLSLGSWSFWTCSVFLFSYFYFALYRKMSDTNRVENFTGHLLSLISTIDDQRWARYSWNTKCASISDVPDKSNKMISKTRSWIRKCKLLFYRLKKWMYCTACIQLSFFLSENKELSINCCVLHIQIKRRNL